MKYSYVYIISDNTNQKIYIGVTSNLLNRIIQHRTDDINCYASRYNIYKLVYFEEFLNIETAIRREKNLKGKLRNKKFSLINAMNPDWLDLYDFISDQKDITIFTKNRDNYLKYIKKKTTVILRESSNCFDEEC